MSNSGINVRSLQRTQAHLQVAINAALMVVKELDERPRRAQLLSNEIRTCHAA